MLFWGLRSSLAAQSQTRSCRAVDAGDCSMSMQLSCTCHIIPWPETMVVLGPLLDCCNLVVFDKDFWTGYPTIKPPVGQTHVCYLARLLDAVSSLAWRFAVWSSCSELLQPLRSRVRVVLTVHGGQYSALYAIDRNITWILGDLSWQDGRKYDEVAFDADSDIMFHLSWSPVRLLGSRGALLLTSTI